MERELRITGLVIAGIKGRCAKNRMTLTERNQVLCVFE